MSPFRRLVRHFLNSFLASDLLPPDADPRQPLVVSGVIFGVPGFFVCLYCSMFPPPYDGRPELAVFLAIPALLCGLLATLAWDTLLPSRADFSVLRPLPLSAGSIVLAKLAALGLALALFELVVNAFYSLALPVLVSVETPGIATLLRRIAAQVAATVAASLLVLLAALAVQGLFAALGADDTWPGRLARLGVLIALATGLVVAPQLAAPDTYFRMVATPSAVARPLQWFLGLDLWLRGQADATAAARAHAGLAALGLAALAAAALFALGSWRRYRAVVAPTPPAARRTAAFGLLPARGLPGPEARATCLFTLRTLARCRAQSFALTVWAGLGIALGTANVTWLLAHHYFRAQRELHSTLLAAPLVLGLFALLGLRQAFLLPAEPRSNWIFRLSEHRAPGLRLRAADRAMLLLGLLPVAALDAAIAFAILPPAAAAAQSALAAAALWLLQAVLLHDFHKLPCTCLRLTGRRRMKFLWLVYWFAYLFLADEAGQFQLLWSRHPARLAALALALAAAAWLLDRRRARDLAQLDTCQFEETADPAVQELMRSQDLAEVEA